MSIFCLSDQFSDGGHINDQKRVVLPLQLSKSQTAYAICDVCQQIRSETSDRLASSHLNYHNEMTTPSWRSLMHQLNMQISAVLQQTGDVRQVNQRGHNF